MIKYLILNGSMVINFNDKTFILTSGDDKYQRILSCITSGSLNLIPPILDISHLYKESGIVTKGDVIYLNGIPLNTIIGKE